jgi:hypothetical protein
MIQNVQASVERAEPFLAQVHGHLVILLVDIRQVDFADAKDLFDLA